MVDLALAKNYLRIDYDGEDDIINVLLTAAKELCADVARCSTEELGNSAVDDTAVLFAVGYLYEHRDEADHRQLNLTLRDLLYSRREGKY